MKQKILLQKYMTLSSIPFAMAYVGIGLMMELQPTTMIYKLILIVTLMIITNSMRTKDKYLFNRDKRGDELEETNIKKSSSLLCESILILTLCASWQDRAIGYSIVLKVLSLAYIFAASQLLKVMQE